MGTCTLSGEATLPFSVSLPSQMGSPLKGMNLLLEEQILSFKSRPHSGRAMSFMEISWKSRSLRSFPFVKMARNHGGVPIRRIN